MTEPNVCISCSMPPTPTHRGKGKEREYSFECRRCGRSTDYHAKKADAAKEWNEDHGKEA